MSRATWTVRFIELALKIQLNSFVKYKTDIISSSYQNIACSCHDIAE